MSSHLSAVVLDADDPDRLARFWADLLGRTVAPDPRGPLAGSPTQVGLRFAHATSAKAGLNRLHLHLTSHDADEQQATVDHVIRLGGAHLDVGQLPEEGHIVLADPEGNEFCVIEPRNAYLAGCGHLGEVACDGTQQVGYFWAEALGWPLVWDQDQETAIQSPHGGTKVAWGGPPLEPKHGRNRQRFELTVPDGDFTHEVGRLTDLGAAVLLREPDADVVELADPDGNEFELHRLPRAGGRG
ncbi:VOC family protein [Agilicoccus flavus]|uniref:VOC family protein n=1 Tax=Agilicoccus flavus TaxID=2775968 RepID=UPI001CF6DDDB|nr:VOC family protein [Agilicoccus flavus]